LKKLKFSVKYDLMEMANSEIMKVKMYIVSEGNNLHQKPISWEAIQSAKPTLIGKPIVAKYNKWTKDLMGHEIDEVPIGVILRDEDIFEETIDGKRWLGAVGDIWMRYSQDISGVLIRDMLKDLSMEILVAEESDMGDIEQFAFTGVTLINENPAIPDARAEVLSFQEVKDEIEKRVFSKDDESQLLNSINEKIDLLTDKIDKFKEKDGEQMEKDTIVEEKMSTDETSEEKMSAGEAKEEEMAKEEDMGCGDKMASEEKMEEEVKEEKMTSDAYVESSAQEAMLEDVAEDQAEAAEEENKPGVMEIEVTIYEGMQTELVDLKAKVKAMEEDKDVYMSELEALKTFKADYDAAKFSKEVESTLLEASDIPKDIREEFKTLAAEKFSVDTIQEWKNIVFAKAYEYSKGSTKKNKHMSIDIPKETKDDKKSNGLWN